MFQGLSMYNSSKLYLLSTHQEPGMGGAKCFTCMVIFTVHKTLSYPFYTGSWGGPKILNNLVFGSQPRIGSWIQVAAAAAAKLLQSCPTLCDPIDSSPPGSPVPGILQARTLEWVAMSFSNAWKWKVKMKTLSRVQLLATPWTAAHQAPPSMGFSRQEYWSGVPLLNSKS